MGMSEAATAYPVRCACHSSSLHLVFSSHWQQLEHLVSRIACTLGSAVHQ